MERQSRAAPRRNPTVGCARYFPLKKSWWLRLHEKGGRGSEMGCHHKLEQFLDEYIAAAADRPEIRRQ
jgi:hypothetical protein